MQVYLSHGKGYEEGKALTGNGGQNVKERLISAVGLEKWISEILFKYEKQRKL